MTKARKVLRVAKTIKVEEGAIKFGETTTDAHIQAICDSDRRGRGVDSNVESQQLKKPLEALSLRFGTDEYKNPEVLTHLTPSFAKLDKGTVGRLPVEFIWWSGHNQRVRIYFSICQKLIHPIVDPTHPIHR